MFPWQRRRRQQSIQGDTCFATLICHSAATACTQLRDIVCAERRCLPMSAGRQMSTVYQMARPGLVKTKKAGSKSWGRHQACEDLGSALTSCRLGRRAQQIWCQGDADVKARTSHERPSRRYFFQASYSDATWHTAVGKATGTCESLGRGTGAPRGVLPLVRPICAGVSSLHAALDNLLQVL